MTEGCRWNPILERDEAAKALSIARDVASRLRDPTRVEAMAAAARQQTDHLRSTHWRPYGVAQGYAGTALFLGAADAAMPGEGWDLAAHQHLQPAVRAAEKESRLTYGMSAGVGGLAFAAWYLSRQGTRYGKLLRSMDAAVVHLVTSATTTLAQTLHRGSGVSTFDVISGFAGVGRHLLLRRDDPPHRAALEGVLRFLVALSREENGVPLWHTPAPFIADPATQRIHPHGNLNCGLAHGIPGPLALLSLAATHGVVVEGQSEAIRRIADWLCGYRMRDQWGLNWPTAVPLGPGGLPIMPPLAPEEEPAAAYRPSRAAWCYGSPGVARSLWFAGKAIADPGYQDIAVAAMEAVYRRPLAARHIDAPTFCHGVAGLQQITLRFAHDSGLPLFNDAARALNRQLLDAYEPASLLGYRNLEPGGRWVDQPGLLNGAPGVALVLLAASTPVEPRWDTLFLLS
jgi:lantibiotic biosynthesis protein